MDERMCRIAEGLFLEKLAGDGVEAFSVDELILAVVKDVSIVVPDPPRIGVIAAFNRLLHRRQVEFTDGVVIMVRARPEALHLVEPRRS